MKARGLKGLRWATAICMAVSALGVAFGWGIQKAAAEVRPSGEKEEGRILKPGDCWPSAGVTPHVCNEGSSDFGITIKGGKLVSINTGAGDIAAYVGDGQRVNVTGTGTVLVVGSGNTITSTMGGSTLGSGGAISITGNKNTVNNVDNGKGNTAFVAENDPGVGNANTLNLGGEKGNFVGGSWQVNP